jgi:hypothetical protein
MAIARAICEARIKLQGSRLLGRQPASGWPATRRRFNFFIRLSSWYRTRRQVSTRSLLVRHIAAPSCTKDHLPGQPRIDRRLRYDSFIADHLLATKFSPQCLGAPLCYARKKNYLHDYLRMALLLVRYGDISLVQPEASWRPLRRTLSSELASDKLY